MSRTKINVSAVIDAYRQISSAKTYVGSAKSSFTQTKNSIDSKIKNRSNIRNRLDTVQRQLSNIDSKIGRIRSTVQSGANQYRSTDDKVESMKKQVNASFVTKSATVQFNKWADYFKDRINTDVVADKARDGASESNKRRTFLELLSSVTKGIGKYGKNEKLSLASSVVAYFDTLTKLSTGAYQTNSEASSSILSLLKSSCDVETGLYKYYEKTLNPYAASKLGDRFGKSMANISVISGIADTADEFINTKKVFSDPNSSVYNKSAQTLRMLDSTANLGGKVYIASQASSKTLQFVNSAGNSTKAVNQILATEQKLTYTTSAAVTKKISNVNTALAITNVVTKFGSSALDRWDQVGKDGNVTIVDGCSVVTYGCIGGLDGVMNGLTLGIVDIDSEQAAAHLESDLDTFIHGDSWAAKYIRNQENDVITRFCVSVGSGAYILGENVADGIVEGGKAVGSWISSCRIDLVGNGNFAFGGGLGAGGGGGGAR